MADTAPQGDILNDDKATWEAFEAYLLNKIDDIDLVPPPTAADIRLRTTGKYGNSISKVTRDVRDWIHGDAVGGQLDGVVRLRGGVLLRDSTLVRTGAGDPEGSIVANVGSLFLRSDAPTADDLLYLKESGVGDTGWQAVSVGGGGGETWAATLVLGSASQGGGTDNPTISDGDSIVPETTGNPSIGSAALRFNESFVGRMLLAGAVAADAAATADDEVIGSGGGGSFGQTINMGAAGAGRYSWNNGTNLEDGQIRYSGAAGSESFTIRTRNVDRLGINDVALFPAAVFSLGATGSRFADGFIDRLLVAGAVAADADAGFDDEIIGNGSATARGISFNATGGTISGLAWIDGANKRDGTIVYNGSGFTFRANNANRFTMDGNAFAPVSDGTIESGLTGSRWQVVWADLVVAGNGVTLGDTVADGPTMFAGTGAPGGALGANGDFYFDATGGAGAKIYNKAAGVWTAFA